MQIVQGQHEPLISETLFYQVQDALDGRRRSFSTKVVLHPVYHFEAIYIAQNAAERLQEVPLRVEMVTTTIIIVNQNAVSDIMPITQMNFS